MEQIFLKLVSDMKKKFFLILFFTTYFSYSQCELSLDNLLELLTVNSSEYETKVLVKNYDYDSESDAFFCLSNNNTFGISKRFKSGKYYGFLYFNDSKDSYLGIKKALIEMNFQFLKKTKIAGFEAYVYKANNIYVSLYTETVNQKPNYNILVQIDLLE